MWSFEDIPKKLIIQNQTFALRGIVAFRGPERSQLRNPSGHYKAYCFRSNGTWDCNNDTKEKIKACSLSFKVNLEVLLYTV